MRAQSERWRPGLEIVLSLFKHCCEQARSAPKDSHIALCQEVVAFLQVLCFSHPTTKGAGKTKVAVIADVFDIDTEPAPCLS